MSRKKGTDAQRVLRYRQSGHLVDQKLKYEKKPHCATQLKLDELPPAIREKIAKSHQNIRYEGIRLTPSQDRLLNALSRLLSEHSENQDESSPLFYQGNFESEIVQYGKIEGKSAKIRIYPSDLYKAYLDTKDYSGDQIKLIKKLLQDLEEIKFLIIYERRYTVSRKGKIETRIDRIEDFQSLIKVVSFFEGLSHEERAKIDRGDEKFRDARGELIIAFNPLLTDQINAKYVEYPIDINRRTIIASGGAKKVSESIIVLRDYLLREKSAGRRRSEINADTLIRLLKLDNYVKSRRKAQIQKKITSAIQTVKNLGLITHYEFVIGSKNQMKYVFHLNENFWV